MTILRFPPRRRASADFADGLALLQGLISECRKRRAGRRLEGARLRTALRRLRILRGSMARDRHHLRQSLRRLHACRETLGAARREV